MSQTLLDHIPNRIHSKLAIASFYLPSNQQPKVLALTSDRRLFELERKEIVFEIDLSQSVLKDVDLPPTFCCRAQNRLDCLNASQICVDEDDRIQLGKYYGYDGYTKRLFILVKVADKLVVVERSAGGFKFIKSYSNVDRFQISDPVGNYRAVVTIHFLNFTPPATETFIEYFRDDKPSTSKAASEPYLDESLRHITERVALGRAELAMQQIATRRRFVALKDQLMFGPDQLRSDAIEEKQPLGKYGDIWMRVVGDFLVIGVPVINNCSRR